MNVSNTAGMSQEQMERLVIALEKLGVWADWTGYVGDGNHPGVFESNSMAHVGALEEASNAIAGAIREGLHEIAEAIIKSHKTN